jgi:thiamine pyrophosphate-dependent acetolactate synthase large subunit-like protein
MTEEPSADGGEAVLEAFRALKIDYVFSSPGSEWGPFWEALGRQKLAGSNSPAFVSCWHEVLAVDLAIGFTLATGRMQAVMLHAGGGLLQGAVAIQAAQMQNVPMLVLSGESLTYGERAGFDPGLQWYQNLSVVGGTHRLAEPYTKWAGQAPGIETLYQSIIRCGEIAKRVPAGPVYLSIPVETQLSLWRKPSMPASSPSFVQPCAPAAEIERVAGLVAKAQWPLITTEAAGRDPATYHALLELAETFAVPVIETPSAIFSNFPRRRSCHQGSNMGAFAAETDLILAVRSRVPWYPPARRPHGTVVLIDEEPHRSNMVYQNTQADMLLEGDVAHSLRELTRTAAPMTDPDAIARRRKTLDARHEARQAHSLAAIERAKQSCPIEPLWLLSALGEALPPDTIYVDETVTHVTDVAESLPNEGFGSYLKVRGGLGQGLGHALGIKLAHRARTVVCLIGDGALLYNPVPQCLGFAAQAALPILIVVFNNGEYRSMRLNQTAYYPDGIGQTHGYFPGARIDGPEYARLGEPFGCAGCKVVSPDELVPALKKARRATLQGTSAILDVCLSR